MNTAGAASARRTAAAKQVARRGVASLLAMVDRRRKVCAFADTMLVRSLLVSQLLAVSYVQVQEGKYGRVGLTLRTTREGSWYLQWWFPDLSWY
jgi:hypothetical protein